MTPLEMIADARAADQKAIEDLNNRYWDRAPPIEERLAFVEWRLKLWVGNIAAAVEALAQKEGDA